MTRPIPAAHLQAIFSPRRDTPRAYPSPVTGNKTGTFWASPDAYRPDPIELLRERIREDDRHKGAWFIILSSMLLWATIAGCVWLIVSGRL